MRRRWADYLYVAPALAVMAFVIAFPLGYTVYVSFFKTTARNTRGLFPALNSYTGLDNYRDILTDSTTFWDITRNTIYWTVGSDRPLLRARFRRRAHRPARSSPAAASSAACSSSPTLSQLSPPPTCGAGSTTVTYGLLSGVLIDGLIRPAASSSSMTSSG